MIVTCASCLTKFNLDESKIPARGAKVRCSRCKHIFFVAPPAAPKEEIVEDFESFAKSHHELLEPGAKKPEAKQPEVKKPEPKRPEPKRPEVPPKPRLEMEPPEPLETEEMPSLEEALLSKPKERPETRGAREEKRPAAKLPRPEKTVRERTRGPSRVIALLAVVVLLVFGAFYLWTELESGGKLSPYIQNPLKKVTQLWEQIWRTKKEGLAVRDLNQYEETVGNTSFLVIEGKIANQSGISKRHIKVRVIIYDQSKKEIDRKEVLCGRTLTQDELKALPADFFKGDLIVLPENEGDKVVTTGKSSPFIVIFRGLGGRAKEFQVDIVDAPDL
jgi:predicted Zn finger-like uncharacterized protein